MEVKGGSTVKKIVCFYEALGSCLLMIAYNWQKYSLDDDTLYA